MTSLPRHHVTMLPDVPAAVRPPRVSTFAGVLALLVAAAISGCATTQARPPQSYEKMSIAAFADSLGYESHPSPDPKGGSAIVKRVENKMVGALRKEFARWCRENGGESGSDPKLEAAANEYGEQLSEQSRFRQHYRTNSVACRTQDQSMLAGYFYIGESRYPDGQVVFYDAASAQAFVNAFGQMAQARGKEETAKREEEDAKYNARVAEIFAKETAQWGKEAADKRDDPHPEHEAQRIQLMTELSQVLSRSSEARFNYLGYCRIEFSTGGGRSTIFPLQDLNHALLTNVEWIDTPATGTIYRVTLADKTGVEAGRITVLGQGAAQQLVVSLEQLGQSCGAW